MSRKEKSRKSAQVVAVNPIEVRLKKRIREHLRNLGFARDSSGGLVPPSQDKDVVRSLHKVQRRQVIVDTQAHVRSWLPKLNKYFADGAEVNVDAIAPRLERVYSDTWQGDLFRLASLTWSVPVSSGYGRRLRFLVWDDSNGKLIGILAVGDPVFNLAVRDSHIGWTGTERKERLVNIMDAYVLGAVPPYNMLLGGKLVACLLRSKELYDEFKSVYGSSVGVISGENKGARLLAVTTTSSMGRSSLYNRLKLDGIPYFSSLGFTGGWGHFHVPDSLFNDLRGYLQSKNIAEADMNAFGQGPNWRIRTIRSALGALGFRGDILKHGVQREAFISLLADNSASILRSGKGRPELKNLRNVNEIAELAKERWLKKRASNRTEYLVWQKKDLGTVIKTGTTAMATVAAPSTAAE
jgi:hypothetical protein